MVKKIFLILVALLAAAFIVLNFFPIDTTNPPVVPTETLEAGVTVPPDISLILGRSCSDCHTNQTIYPWYSRIQPVAWYLKGHIDDGRRKLNFSVWNTYPAKKRSKKLEEICDQVESKEMPLPSYLWIHRDSILSDSDAKALCVWAKQEKARVDAVIDNAPTSD
ncbi:MAG: heme-binding domain-containing protein [Pyrinomonadaceae bacterium]